MGRSTRAVAITLIAVAATLAACSTTNPPTASTTGTGTGPSTGSGRGPGTAPGAATPAGSSQPIPDPLGRPEVLAGHIAVPWGIAFLPDGSALIPERDTGAILQWKPGQSGTARPTEVMRLASVVASPEGGLLGLAVSPTYTDDGQVYAYYSGDADNRIVRFRLGGPETVLVSGIKKNIFHDGGRLAFGPDRKLYASTGDAGDKPSAQDPASLNGKILRMEADGRVPADNPFPGSLVYTLGHRNVQGLTWDDGGRLWSAELGQDTWDELNLIEAGHNYGWPVVEGTGDTDGGRFTNPIRTWKPAEASPSGIAFWRGALYIGALRGTRLWRVPIDDTGHAGDPVALLTKQYGRLRTPIVAPDGSLWVSTSNTDGRGVPGPDDDRVLRFTG